jgi:predicted NodU family carbamoyl transferase
MSLQVTLEWLCRLQQQTGETNLCLVGGVVQNSVLDGRVAREAGFEHVFIPPYPGDEGIAAGCAAYALHALLPQLGVPAPARRGSPWPACMGRAYSAAEVQAAMDEFSPWIEEVTLAAAPRTAPDGGSVDDETDEDFVSAEDLEEYRALEAELEAELAAQIKAELEAEIEAARPTSTAETAAGAGAQDGVGAQDGAATGPSSAARGGARDGAWDAPSAAVLQYTAEALARGEIVGWVNGRAEVGARALGHRSILANPAMTENHRKVNHVKQREQWRPLAPSVLAEEADSWFDGLPTLASPYMQITATVRPEVREQVPAITHVDGSARLQTVGEADAPIYHALIAAFFALVGVPMLLNTSFNLARMPIVESPRDALACFLEADEALSLLVLHGRLIRRRPFPTGAHATDGFGWPPSASDGSMGACLGLLTLGLLRMASNGF